MSTRKILLIIVQVCPVVVICDLGFSMNQPESGVKGHVILLVCE